MSKCPLYVYLLARVTTDNDIDWNLNQFKGHIMIIKWAFRFPIFQSFYFCKNIWPCQQQWSLFLVIKTLQKVASKVLYDKYEWLFFFLLIFNKPTMFLKCSIPLNHFNRIAALRLLVVVFVNTNIIFWHVIIWSFKF